MPTTKGKGGTGDSPAKRYRPASEFDDATLAQKREYWRTKKREQRARLSETRARPKQDSRRDKPSPRSTSVAFNSGLSSCKTVSAPLLQNNVGSYKAGVASAVSLSGNGVAGGSAEASLSQKEKWFQRIKLNKVLPQFPGSSSRSAKAAVVNRTAVKRLPTGGAVSGFITSPKLNGALLNSSSSVPLARVTVQPSGPAPCQPKGRMTSTNGSSSIAAPQPCMTMQGASVPKAQPKAQVTLRIQPKPITANVTTGMKLVSSPSAPVLINIDGSVAYATPQVGKQSALVTTQRARGIANTPGANAKPESVEERAARRREQWRIKKREQRAKQAARLAKAIERTPNTEVGLQKQMLQRTGQAASMVLEHLPSSLRGAGQRQYVGRVKTPFISTGRLLKNARGMAASSSTLAKHTNIAVKKENQDLQPSAAKLTTINLNQNKQPVQIKVEDPQMDKKTHAGITPNVIVEKMPGEQSRKLPFHVQVSNRGIARCRTPRQRFIEAQRSFLGQRNGRGRSFSLTQVFMTRNAPKVDPNETPEQQAARKREYWRTKKREQRAKMSMEVKAKLKERDCLMRRVKRYQSILEEMRRVRAGACTTVTQPMGNALIHASETIGGFIKEDGTLTINIPQIPFGSATAASKTRGEIHTLSTNYTNIKPQHQFCPKPAGNATRNVGLGGPIRINPPPPLLRPAQVKVSFPLAGQSVNKPPRLLSIRPRTAFQSTTKTVTNTHTIPIQSPSQITLTHPQALQRNSSRASAAGPNRGGCVMKMAVASSPPSKSTSIPPSITAITLDPELTEEERMAKKREYWRVKKREQRAARAVRLKQGVLQARGNAALQRRRVQRSALLQQRALTNIKVSTTVTNRSVNIQTDPNTSVPVTPQANEIKQERESTPAVDLNSQPEPTICPDIKPPPSPPSPPPPPPSHPLGPQSESDPALSADNQATTLLAVASMKKLLEESLSTVAECESDQAEVQTDQLSCKTEPEACVLEEFSEQDQEMKPDVPLLSLGDDEKVPIATDLTLDIKSWQANADTLVPTCPPSPHLKTSPSMSESLSLSLSCTETVPHPTSEPTSHASESSCLCSSMEASDGVDGPSPRRAQRLRAKRAGHHHCCSPEPPKLHHPPLIQQHPQQQQPQQYEQRCQPPPLVQRPEQYGPAGAEKSPASSLQRKREYWRLMKRQQRARSKARQYQGVRQGDYGRRFSPRAAQAPNLLVMKTAKPPPVMTSTPRKPVLHSKPSTASLTAVTTIPTLLVVSPTTSNAGQPPDTLQVKPPISSSHSGQRNEIFIGSSQPSHTLSTTSLPRGGDVTVPPLGNNGMDGRLLLVENQQEATPCSSSDPPRVRKWTLQMQESLDMDTASSLPTLTPPANPLSSIKLLPIEPQTPTCTSTFSPRKIPRPQPLSPPSVRSPPTKLVPTGHPMVPPKPIPGESEEDFLKRKREYWRVKKKEQRARKAMRDRGLTQRRASNNWRPIQPTQDQLQGMETQDSGQWMNSSEDSELLMSTSSDVDPGYFPYPNYTAPIEDDSDILFTDYHDDNNNNTEDDGSISDGAWRTRYLMDHDPLNQLLVCMVCGDLQYSHSLEGVRAHIEEAHPETLNLEAPERRRILEAWDEQVSQRERFFTSQLQQHSGALEEAQRN